MRLAIIPARGNSKRIPNKNILSFCGQPMIAYALKTAHDSQIFDRIHVSTDSHNIAETTAQLGFPVDFLRDQSLAEDHVGLLPVLQWVVRQYEQRGLNFDTICCILPTTPLLVFNDLVSAFQIFSEHQGASPTLAFAKFPVPIEWAFKKNSQGVMTAVNPCKLSMKSQDLDHAYYECGAFGIYNREHLKMRNPFSNGVLPYILPMDRAVDIDTVEDLVFAEALFRVHAESRKMGEGSSR
jgi:pseudaminic acid cytidylyltransferase